MARSLQTYNTGAVNYTFSIPNKKWTFSNGSFTFITSCPGGRKTADKVANIVNGSLKRCNALDGLARANISKIIN